MDEKERLHQLQPEIVESLKQLIAIDSVQGAPAPGAPYGAGPARCLQAALALCDRLGLRTHNMDGHLGWAEYGEGAEMVAVLGHLDVVPAGSGWTVCEPFAPAVRDGRLYGRGAIDDKGPTVAALYALRALMDTGFAPRRRVRILLGCSEETGSGDMAYYRAHGGEIPVAGFTPDGEYPLINGEKGLVKVVYEKKLAQRGAWQLLSIRGGTAFNIVPAAAAADIACPEDVSVLAGLQYPPKVHVTPTEYGLHVEAAGISAHGSMPEKGENAIGRLCLFLRQLPLSPDAAAMVGWLADKIGMDTTGRAFGIDLRDSLSGALSFNLGVIESDAGTPRPAAHAGEAPAPAGARAVRVTINYRFPVTFHYADCGPALNAAFAAAGWTVASESREEALYQPESSPLVQKLLGVYRAATGDLSPALCIGGGTYAKSIPNILAFGPVFPGETPREHQPDEYVELSRLMLSAEISAAAIRALAE